MDPDPTLRGPQLLGQVEQLKERIRQIAARHDSLQRQVSQIEHYIDLTASQSLALLEQVERLEARTNETVGPVVKGMTP